MIPSDPLYAQQWHFVGSLGGIDDPLGSIQKIWDEYSGTGIAVGIYDGGVELDHPDLAANYDPTLLVIVNGDPVDGEPNEAAPHQHGTNVLGLLDAAANNGTGGVGVAWGSTFTSVDILDPDSPVDINSEDPTDILAAFHQLTNFDVSNHSWNGLATSAYDPTYNLYGPANNYGGLNSEYDHASANGRVGLGTIIVQGVGNSNIDAQYTGLNASRFTTPVGGIQQDGFASSFSNYGAALFVTAPSVNMVTTHIAGVNGDPDDYIDAADNAAFPPDGLFGRSLATPVVSGVAALMLDANAGLGWRDVQNIIAASATHTGSAIGASTPGTNENSK